MLMWKVKKDTLPKRLVDWLERKRLIMPRIDTIERCWSRTTESWWNWLDMEIMQGDKISPVNTYQKDCVKTNVKPFGY